jgi:hypothetical protein
MLETRGGLGLDALQQDDNVEAEPQVDDATHPPLLLRHQHPAPTPQTLRYILSVVVSATTSHRQRLRLGGHSPTPSLLPLGMCTVEDDRMNLGTISTAADSIEV